MKSCSRTEAYYSFSFAKRLMLEKNDDPTWWLIHQITLTGSVVGSCNFVKCLPDRGASEKIFLGHLV